jgi:asparagine synthase (glutamine-hydrolysing)
MTRGYAYDQDKLLLGKALAQFFAREPKHSLGSALLRANGLFSVVRVTGRSLVAAVDRIRSIPLFYALGEDCFYLSDDAYWVSGQVPGGYDELSVAEFLLAGHVWGRNTLRSRVKELQAGEMLFVEEEQRVPRISLTRYYNYVHHDYFTCPKESILAEWDAILLRTFDRLVRSVGGRTIVVPLSGGYDSRLIAIMLRRLRYENVICFTYGIPEHWEAGIAQQVARGLGYRWEFIPYSHELWYQAFHSKEFRSLVRFADGLTSVVPFQDWPAVQKLKEHGTIPKDSVIVPGHGIYTTVRWLLQSFIREYRVSKNHPADEIVRDHFSLWDSRELHDMWCWKTPPKELRLRLKKKVLGIIGDIPRETVQANAAEYWAWQERQAKLFANSVRVYEYLGYDWRMPLWDSEVISFWERVPVHYGLRKELCIDYVKRVQSSLGLDSIKEHLTLQKRLLSSMNLLETATRLGLVDRFGSIMARPRKLSYKWAYRSDPHARYGIMPIEKFRSLYSRKPENIYSLLALERLGMISF